MLFVMAMSQSPGLPETLAAADNPGMGLLAFPVVNRISFRMMREFKEEAR